jgi:hypothetical protein
VSDGKITVPVNITNTKYGYRVYVTPIIPQAPYKDVMATIPGKIETENYDVGGSSKAYLDKDDENKGGEYREDAVDIVKTVDGYAIGYTQEGEWLEYTVNVEREQEYALQISYATSSENTGIKLYVDGKAVLENVTFEKGANWDTYATLDAGMVKLPKGEHILKMEIVGNYVNIDWLDFKDPTTTALRPSRSLRLNVADVEYHVFDMQGQLVAKIRTAGSADLQTKIRAAVKRSGVYLVKPRAGGQMFTVSVK